MKSFFLPCRNGAKMKEARLRIIFQKFNWGKIRKDYPKSVPEKKTKPIKEVKTKNMMKKLKFWK